ncbi:MAG: cation diffusion facilitator family transporter [Alphaproteobacteria bacterium]|nr:cation diffusion facilitator family transporter [Alphaproteobacteria bacterium]
MSIANPHLQEENTADTRLKKAATMASLAVAGILIVTKFMAYAITGSVSIMSSLLDSAFDMAASFITLLGIIQAAAPADHSHRFGHGKIEALAAMGQALFVAGSALFLLFESLHRFLHPKAIAQPTIGIYVMLLSIALTLLLVLFQKYVIDKTQSVAVSADHLHYKGDLLMNLGVIATITASMYTPWPYLDPLFAGAVALYLLYGARDIGRDSVDILLDRELPDADREKILALASSHPAARAVHDLRTRTTGDRMFIEFHLEMDADMSLSAAHDVTEEIEKILYDSFPKSEVIIHQEPYGIDDHRLDDQIAKA